MTQDFVPESEAASFAGVSCNTLSRFAEAGYLKIETDRDGGRRYCKAELSDLFGLPATTRGSIEVSVVSDTAASAEPNGRFEDEEIYHAEVLTVDESQPESDELRAGAPLFEPFEYLTPKMNSPEAASRGEIEIVKLQSMVRLQDKIMTMKDDEIKGLRKECEWLRGRIERYEEKNDRDQLLLLAETQLIRKFVLLQTQKKPSPLRVALEWIGLVPPVKDTDLTLTNNSGPIVEQK